MTAIGHEAAAHYAPISTVAYSMGFLIPDSPDRPTDGSFRSIADRSPEASSDRGETEETMGGVNAGQPDIKRAARPKAGVDDPRNHGHIS